MERYLLPVMIMWISRFHCFCIITGYCFNIIVIISIQFHRQQRRNMILVADYRLLRCFKTSPAAKRPSSDRISNVVAWFRTTFISRRAIYIGRMANNSYSISPCQPSIIAMRWYYRAGICFDARRRIFILACAVNLAAGKRNEASRRDDIDKILALPRGFSMTHQHGAACFYRTVAQCCRRVVAILAKYRLQRVISRAVSIRLSSADAGDGRTDGNESSLLRTRSITLYQDFNAHPRYQILFGEKKMAHTNASPPVNASLNTGIEICWASYHAVKEQRARFRMR